MDVGICGRLKFGKATPSWSKANVVVILQSKALGKRRHRGVTTAVLIDRRTFFFPLFAGEPKLG